ncbi:Colicin-D [Raoultella terrigena]|uniref:Colicin-D n=1 Tax=Raoultella terrigena TaxID=577 RepID=A0A3P8M152_RAOTE|nr:Colicin-D [Raoultella terrigena]
MALSRAPGMIQLSAVGVGTLPFNSGLAGWESSALWRGVDVLARIAPVASAVATVATVLTLVRAALDIPAAGEGSDRVPGRDINMLAAQASLYTAMKTEIKPGMKTVDLPVRGYISDDGNGRQSVNLVRTGTGGISATVPVLNGVRDKATGLDKITVPAVAGAPSRTILVNPVPVGPAAPSHTGNSSPAPVTPVHTGTEVKQADSIVTTTFPAADIPPLQDFIYWQPDATGTGVEPIYVMLNSPPKSVNHKHKHYPPKGVPWKDIVNKTANGGSAKFKPDVNIPEIDIDAWENGQTTAKHPTWKVKKYDYVIGAYAGKETQWVVVKESQGVIHSHPVSEQKAKEYMK